MIRFVAHLMLIPGVLLTQVAAVPHAHAGSPGTAHESHPHFHFHLFGSNDPAASACRACRDSDCPERDRAEPVPPWDHDADAVYVEPTTASPEHEKHFAPVFFAGPALERLPLLCNARVTTARHTDSRERLTVRCPLYVRFLALTI